MTEKNLQDHPEWHAWLDQNVDRGCEIQGLVDTLLEQRFSRVSIDRAIALRAQQVTEQGRQAARAAPALTQPDNGRFVLRANSAKLELYLLEDFLDETECAALIAAGDSRLRPSDLTLPAPDAYFRTSKTCDLGLLDHPMVETISRKICDTLGIDYPHAEVMQLQKYEVSEEFKMHTDYFEPGTIEYTKFCPGIGNRTWTFMIYLNHVERGGGTRFFAIDKTINPKRGMAVIWNNLLGNGTPNPNTAHAGMPVSAGTKYIVTQWFREYPPLPAAASA